MPKSAIARLIRDVPILWGDSDHDDSAVIRLLLTGGAAYDMRSAEMIVAPTLALLPPGAYCMQPSSLPPRKVINASDQATAGS